MSLHELAIKGIARYLIDDRLTGEPIHMHISAVAPSERSHPPHQHPGYEAFYIFEGQGTVELDGETSVLRAGEAIVFDSTRMHGLVNTGDQPLRYLVVLRP
ncbi:MAG: cupin domain-containing protein [Roseiflexaceae bacterium]|nr:cupin domain-containing protein [Roseiflexaceae bacterium]